jgi:hypothetical protein
MCLTATGINFWSLIRRRTTSAGDAAAGGAVAGGAVAGGFQLVPPVSFGGASALLPVGGLGLAVLVVAVAALLVLPRVAPWGRFGFA